MDLVIFGPIAPIVALALAMAHPLVVLVLLALVMLGLLCVKVANWNERHPGYRWIWTAMFCAIPVCWVLALFIVAFVNGDHWLVG
jgi:hypothetical protein